VADTRKDGQRDMVKISLNI